MLKKRSNKKLRQRKIYATPTSWSSWSTPTESGENHDDHIVTSSSTLIVMVTLFCFFILIFIFCCYQRCKATASCEVKPQTSKEAAVGASKKGIPVVFDNATTSRGKTKSLGNEMGSLSANRGLKVEGINRPPPPPYKSQKNS